MIKRQVGIYAGTFDPVHAGHIAFAMAAMGACGLDEVVFLPERSPRGKHMVTAIKHRIALLDAALPADDRVRVATLESEQFTVTETVPELRTMFPDAVLTLLMGSDVACHSLAHWADLNLLLHSTSFAIGLRATQTLEQVQAAMAHIERDQGIRPDYTVVSAEHASLASSQVRSGDHPPPMSSPIGAYIQRYKLYE